MYKQKQIDNQPTQRFLVTQDIGYRRRQELERYSSPQSLGSWLPCTHVAPLSLSPLFSAAVAKGGCSGDFVRAVSSYTGAPKKERERLKNLLRTTIIKAAPNLKWISTVSDKIMNN